MIAAIDLQSVALLVGLLLILLVLVRSMRRRMQQPAQPRRPAGPRSLPPPTDEEKDVRRSMERLLVELQGISRQINAHLDTKMRALTTLADEARLAIERLERLLAVTRGDLPPDGAAPAHADEPAAFVDPARRRVYELADQGLSPVEIARETDHPVGEIELILSLRAAADPGEADRDERDPDGGQIDLRT